MNTEFENLEDSQLAVFAMRHADSGGRTYNEENDPFRTCFQRDRDRIVHSKAFRRLGYKTQVFVNSAGDNYRTRLTHSLEVSQIARSVSAALQLNRDFAETLALAHDLGHTPFGHAGQDVLHTLMKPHGGFEHNCQSLRIVSRLETRYLRWDGLNLCRATLKGMMKHARIYSCDTDLESICAERSRQSPCLEASIVDNCDRIAYLHHDIEDALDSNLLELSDLMELSPWAEMYRRLEKREGDAFVKNREPVRIRSVIRAMLGRCISDLIETTEKNLTLISPASLGEVLALKSEEYPVHFSESLREEMTVIQKFLFERMYRHPRVMQMSRRGVLVIEFLFHEYVNNPEIMPHHVQTRTADHGLFRVVADYIAGMTDRFALQQYRYLRGEI